MTRRSASEDKPQRAINAAVNQLGVETTDVLQPAGPADLLESVSEGSPGAHVMEVSSNQRRCGWVHGNYSVYNRQPMATGNMAGWFPPIAYLHSELL